MSAAPQPDRGDVPDNVVFLDDYRSISERIARYKREEEQAMANVAFYQHVIDEIDAAKHTRQGHRKVGHLWVIK
jgi:DNA integrity scanning protein DisA with diadenylate cyclase activity